MTDTLQTDCLKSIFAKGGSAAILAIQQSGYTKKSGHSAPEVFQNEAWQKEESVQFVPAFLA